MQNMDHTAAVNFFLRRKAGQFAFRRLPFVPRVGDKCVFHEVRYRVAIVEWCLDEDATERGVRVNVELEPLDATT
jgi:hypothetical protein